MILFNEISSTDLMRVRAVTNKLSAIKANLEDELITSEMRIQFNIDESMEANKRDVDEAVVAYNLKYQEIVDKYVSLYEEKGIKIEVQVKPEILLSPGSVLYISDKKTHNKEEFTPLSEIFAMIDFEYCLELYHHFLEESKDAWKELKFLCPINFYYE